MECEERWKEQGLAKDLASTYVLHPLETKVVLNFRGDETQWVVLLREEITITN